MPDIAQKTHGGRHERVVLGELELGGKDAAFVGSVLGPLDQGFPDEEVVFVDRAGGDALRRVLREVFVFLEEAFRRYGRHFRC